MRSGGTPNLHIRFVEHFVAHGVYQCHLRIHQLRDILIAGRNDTAHTGLSGLLGQRADDIVGFNAIDDQHRPTHRANAGMQRLDLHRQIRRHGRPVRFIVGIQFIAESFTFCIKHARAIIGLVILVQAPQHIEHAMNCAGRFIVMIT